VTEPLQPQGTEGGWNSSSWVGIDGTYGSDDVLQAGVQQQVDANGNAHYVAWFEWFAPKESDSPPYIFQTNIPNFVVSPGQTVFCSVQYIERFPRRPAPSKQRRSLWAGQLVFANETTGQHFSITLAPPPNATFSGNCAEWIMEAPDRGEPISSLPMFTPVVFTSAVCCGPDGTLDNPSDGDTWNIVAADGTTLTSVSLGPDTVTIDYVGPKVVVPDIIGMSAADGLVALREVGLVGIEKVMPADVNSNILEQTPAAGTNVALHSEVIFEIKARPVTQRLGDPVRA
jgi:hypothetical protein